MQLFADKADTCISSYESDKFVIENNIEEVIDEYDLKTDEKRANSLQIFTNEVAITQGENLSLLILSKNFKSQAKTA